MNGTLKTPWRIMVLIALVAIVSMQTIGQTISNVFSNGAVSLASS